MFRIVMIWLLERLWSEWQQVGTFETIVKIPENSWTSNEHPVFIHCFESRWGTRRVEINVQWHAMKIFHYKYRAKVRRARLFQTEIYPWLNGRQHTKIPGFQVVKSKKWDFKKALLGETPVVLNDDEKDVTK